MGLDPGRYLGRVRVGRRLTRRLDPPLGVLDGLPGGGHVGFDLGQLPLHPCVPGLGRPRPEDPVRLGGEADLPLPGPDLGPEPVGQPVQLPPAVVPGPPVGRGRVFGVPADEGVQDHDEVGRVVAGEGHDDDIRGRGRLDRQPVLHHPRRVSGGPHRPKVLHRRVGQRPGDEVA